MNEEQLWLERNTDITSHEGPEFFINDPEMKMNDTPERNSVTEVNIKEETLLSNSPISNKGQLLDQNPVSKHSGTEAKIEIKEEEWWLERNLTGMSSAYDDFKNVTDEEHFPSTESPRSHIGATSSSKSAIFSNDCLGKNVILNMRNAFSECEVARKYKTDTSDVIYCPSIESSVHSEQHDGSKFSIKSNYFASSINIHDYISSKDSAYNSAMVRNNLSDECRKQHKCGISEMSFTQLSHSKKHNLLQDGKKPKCDICKKEFTTISGLKIHKWIHENKRPHKCDTCGKEFTLLSYLKRHKLLHDGKKAYKCDICEKDFSRLPHLKRHKLIHEGKMPYKCDICGRPFVWKSCLKSHKLLHDNKKPYKCDICEKDFRLLSYLKVHKMVHNGKNTYKCDICKKDFGFLSKLKRHKLIHAGKNPYQCDICEKDFSHLSYLKVHKMFHDGKNTHKCDICEKDFEFLSHLKRHKLIHDGKRPYKCDICEKGFRSLSHLKRHKLIHDGKRRRSK